MDHKSIHSNYCDYNVRDGSGNGLFTHTVHHTVSVSGIFDLFDVTCKQHQGCARFAEI